MFTFRFSTLLFVTLSLLNLAASFSIPEDAVEGDVIPNSYIVVMKEDIAPEVISRHETWVSNSSVIARRLMKRGRRRSLAGLRRRYRLGKLKGYTGEFDSQTVEEIKARPEVAFVEEDTVITTQSLKTQWGAPWGLSRISHQSPRDFGSFAYQYDDTMDGRGTVAYVLDTGVWTAHPEFGGRAIWGTTTWEGATNADLSGHGTHVAAIIAGNTFGVAKAARIIAVKVMSDAGAGAASSVISGIQWSVTHCQQNRLIGAINLSLGGNKSNALNNAAESAIAAGLTVVAASGNQGLPAGQFSPGSSSQVITVGAIGQSDTRESYSNYGPEVDIYAPGSGILSAVLGAVGATGLKTGTSMACPHVSGVVLGLLSSRKAGWPAQVKEVLLDMATEVVDVSGVGGSRKLLYNGSGR